MPTLSTRLKSALKTILGQNQNYEFYPQVDELKVHFFQRNQKIIQSLMEIFNSFSLRFRQNADSRNDDLAIELNEEIICALEDLAELRRRIHAFLNQFSLPKLKIKIVGKQDKWEFSFEGGTQDQRRACLKAIKRLDTDALAFGSYNFQVEKDHVKSALANIPEPPPRVKQQVPKAIENPPFRYRQPQSHAYMPLQNVTGVARPPKNRTPVIPIRPRPPLLGQGFITQGHDEAPQPTRSTTPPLPSPASINTFGNTTASPISTEAGTSAQAASSSETEWDEDHLSVECLSTTPNTPATPQVAQTLPTTFFRENILRPPLKPLTRGSYSDMKLENPRGKIIGVTQSFQCKNNTWFSRVTVEFLCDAGTTLKHVSPRRTLNTPFFSLAKAIVTPIETNNPDMTYVLAVRRKRHGESGAVAVLTRASLSSPQEAQEAEEFKISPEYPLDETIQELIRCHFETSLLPEHGNFMRRSL